MFSKFFWASVAGVDEGIDGIGDFAGRVVLMQFPFDPLLAQLSIEFNRGHMREPQILFLSAIVLPVHLEVQFHFSLVLWLMHEEGDLEGIEGQEVAVALNHMD